MPKKYHRVTQEDKEINQIREAVNLYNAYDWEEHHKAVKMLTGEDSEEKLLECLR